MILDYCFEDGNFEYEVDWTDIQSAISVILKDYTQEELIDVILNIETGCEEYFKEELTDYFEEKAYKEYKDACAYNDDKLGFNGLTPNNFI